MIVNCYAVVAIKTSSFREFYVRDNADADDDKVGFNFFISTKDCLNMAFALKTTDAGTDFDIYTSPSVKLMVVLAHFRCGDPF